MMRHVVVAAAGVAMVAATGLAYGAEVRVPALDGTVVAPLDSSAASTVLLFVTVDCPISNRYAPEVRRLHDAFGDGTAFWLVYTGGTWPVAELAAHRASFAYPFPAVRDPAGELVAATGVTVTPEVAVYDRAHRLVYRGRIDDRYVEFGIARSAPTVRDLHDVLARLRAGTDVAFTETRAIGCYIPVQSVVNVPRRSPAAGRHELPTKERGR